MLLSIFLTIYCMRLLIFLLEEFFSLNYSKWSSKEEEEWEGKGTNWTSDSFFFFSINRYILHCIKSILWFYQCLHSITRSHTIRLGVFLFFFCIFAFSLNKTKKTTTTMSYENINQKLTLSQGNKRIYKGWVESACGLFVNCMENSFIYFIMG